MWRCVGHADLGLPSEAVWTLDGCDGVRRACCLWRLRWGLAPRAGSTRHPRGGYVGGLR